MLPDDVSSWTSFEAALWLHSIGMTAFSETAVRKGFGGPHLLSGFSDAELAAYGINDVFHRRAIILRIDMLRQHHAACACGV